jgi:chromosome segregation ATPase
MRKDKAARRSSVFDDLFAERQVYLRSGLTSRYLVLSRALQIAATAGVLLLVAGLGLATYSSLAKHREVAEQSRALARLEEANASLRAAAEAATPPEEIAALTARVPELEMALAEAEAAQAQTQSAAEAARAETAELRRELTRAEERIRELEAAPTVVATTDDVGDADAAPGAPAEPAAGDETRLVGLTTELEQARSERDQLTAQLEDAQDAAEQTIAQLTEQVETAAEETRRLRGELESRTAEATRLQDDLDAALAEAAAPRTATQSAEQALAELQAEMVQPEQTELAEGAAAADLAALKQSAEAAVEQAADLRATLASAEDRIASLSAELESARSELATARQLPASAPAVDGDEPQGAGGPEGDLRARLAAANERIDELESALRQSLLNLAPVPPPPAPR